MDTEEKNEALSSQRSDQARTSETITVAAEQDW